MYDEAMLVLCILFVGLMIVTITQAYRIGNLKRRVESVERRNTALAETFAGILTRKNIIDDTLKRDRRSLIDVSVIKRVF